MRPLSLRLRVSLLVMAVLTAVIAAISTSAYIELRESLLAHMDQSLLVTAKAIVGEANEPQGTQRLAEEVRFITSGRAGRPVSQFRAWRDGSAADLAASGPPTDKAARWLYHLPEGHRPAAGEYTSFGQGEGDGEIRTVWLRHGEGPAELNVAVCASSHKVYHEVREFLRVLVVAGGATTAAAALVCVLMTTWGLRPIARTAARLRGLTEKDLGREDLSDLKAPRELTPFITEVADLLGRVDRALQKAKRFTADASHELRTPLAVAKSTLQVAVSADRENQEYRQAIQETLDDLGRMEALTQAMLDLARVEDGRVDEPAEEVSLGPLLAELAEAAGAQARAGGGRLLCEAGPGAVVRGNLTQLRQMLRNVLDNAVRHGPAGGTVRASLADGPDATCLVTVHDEGGTIPPGEVERLFERFYRADTSRARATGGTGLGLAIAREIARRHGGEIRIASTPADGTTVTIRLPRL